MLGHLPFRHLIVRKLVPHRFQDQAGLLEANQLQQIHIVVEAHIQELFSSKIEESERLNIIILDNVLHASQPLLLIVCRCATYFAVGILRHFILTIVCIGGGHGLFCVEVSIGD